MTPQSRTLSVSAVISNTSTLVPPTRKSANKGGTCWYASKSTGSLLQDCVDAYSNNSNMASRSGKKSRKSAINWPFRKNSSKLAKKSASTKLLAHAGNENGNDSGVSLDFSSSSSTSSSASNTFASVFSSSSSQPAKHSKPTKLFGQSIGKLCQDGKLILPIMVGGVVGFFAQPLKFSSFFMPILAAHRTYSTNLWPKVRTQLESFESRPTLECVVS